jgi:hypothetical protein
MSLDLQNSYQQAQDKLKAFKTFTEVKSAIKDAQKKTENQLTPNFDLSRFQLDQSAIEQKIKKQVQNQFDQLIGLILANKGSGISTFQFIIRKLIRTVKIIKSKILEIIIEEFVRALGCDIEQTYTAGQYYIKVSSIDLFKILQIDPTTKIGKLFYERTPFSPLNIPRSTNRLFWDLIQNELVTMSTLYPGGQNYNGYSTVPLFDIEFNQYNSENGDGSGWFYVYLIDRPDGQPNKVTQFLTDYFKTIDIVNFKAVIAALVEAVLGIVSIKLRFATGTVDDSTKFGLLIQRILGQCFDEDQEISVGGQAKTPVLDDYNDSFFEFTYIDTGIVEERTKNIKNGVVTFETCDNVELPLDVDTIVDLIESKMEFVEDEDTMEDAINSISTSLSNDPRWQASFPYPDQLKISLDFSFIKKIPQACVSAILSPKVIFPFILMIKALGLPYNENLEGLVNFIRQNSELMRNIVSRIGAEFIKTLFNEIKKDIKSLVRAIITDINRDDIAVYYIMIEKLVNIALFVISFVKDYRQCKSVIDAILQLFNLVGNLRPGIPMPLLQLSSFLPGSSPNKGFINVIENMQRTGLPTGPNPDGSPNLALQEIFSILKGQDLENKENGKVEGVLKLPPPYGYVMVTGKSL